MIRSVYSRSFRALPRTWAKTRFSAPRYFHMAPALWKLQPFMLADIGEGIKECEVIQWFVEPGARIEEFDPICEVQSDKASVEITSRFNGVIKTLHYDVGQMALVGKPLCDIDIAEEDSGPSAEPSKIEEEKIKVDLPIEPSTPAPATPSGKFATLATPAVRRVCKELGVELSQVQGTGKDGRVLKEDVIAFSNGKGAETLETSVESSVTIPINAAASVPQVETVTPLTPIQNQMFKTMTNSLSIPHFLYTDELKIDSLVNVRNRINSDLKQSPANGVAKVSYMPFFIKALSLSLLKYPSLNSRVIPVAENGKPAIVHRPQHNIGIAMDTPLGLIVPNIKNVQSLSVLEIASELTRLQQAGASGKLQSSDLKGGTISISNIGNVGGTYLGPVIVDTEVAIVGIGRLQTVPRFEGPDLKVVPQKIINTSWSGDHRVIDGMTMARMAEEWKSYIENPERMLLLLR